MQKIEKNVPDNLTFPSVAERAFKSFRLRYGTIEDTLKEKDIERLCENIKSLLQITVNPTEILYLISLGMSYKDIFAMFQAVKIGSISSAIYTLGRNIEHAQDSANAAETKRQTDDQRFRRDMQFTDAASIREQREAEKKQHDELMRVEQKKLEQQRELVYLETRTLPFEEQLKRWTGKDMIVITQYGELELHKENIYAFITSAITIEQQIELLKWFVIICNLDSDSAYYVGTAKKLRKFVLSQLNTKFPSQVEFLSIALSHLVDMKDAQTQPEAQQ